MYLESQLLGWRYKSDCLLGSLSNEGTEPTLYPTCLAQSWSVTGMKNKLYLAITCFGIFFIAAGSTPTNTDFFSLLSSFIIYINPKLLTTHWAVCLISKSLFLLLWTLILTFSLISHTAVQIFPLKHNYGYASFLLGMLKWFPNFL